MAKKPVIFKPTLFTPTGLNNYPGTVFRCFTKGDTLPFSFSLENEDGSILDVTDYEVWIIMSDAVVGNNAIGENTNLLEVQIPLLDIPTGLFEGSISDTLTNSLPAGIVYAQAKYITTTGETHIIDMCILEVYPSVTYATL